MAVVGFRKRLGDRRVSLGADHLEPRCCLVSKGADLRVAVRFRRVEQVTDGGRWRGCCALGKSAQVRVGVDGDDAIPTGLCEHASKGNGGCGLTDATFQAHHRNAVVAAQGRTDGVDKLLLLELFARTARVDATTSGGVDHFAPALFRRRFHRIHQVGLIEHLRWCEFKLRHGNSVAKRGVMERGHEKSPRISPNM